MNTSSMSRKDVRDLVAASFSGTRYPGDDALSSSGTPAARLRYGENTEGAEVTNLFRGKKWQDVNLNLLRHPLGGFHQGAMHFLSHMAQGYYAPALMIIALDHGADADLFLDDAIEIFSPEFSRDPNAFKDRFKDYSKKQKAAVSEFLRIMAAEEWGGRSENRPLEILERHWVPKVG